MGLIRVLLVIIVSFSFTACLDRLYSDPVQPADAATDPGDAADMDYVQDRPDAGDPDLPDATDPFTEPDTVQPELPDDVVEQDEPVEGDGETCEDPCDPGGTRCSGDSLLTCGEDGCGYGPGAACALACIDDPEPHCAGMAPSNVDDPSLLCAGSSGLELGPEYPETTLVVFNTDDGSITATGDWWETYEVRPAGEGNAGGIVFIVQSQDEPDDPGVLPELAIFSFSDFNVPEGVIAMGTGDRALVILSCGEMAIDGVVSVASNTEWVAFDTGTPGPGGGGGGLEPADNGDGPGGGAAGLYGSDMLDSGGGGGGFGGAGGRGGHVIDSSDPDDILVYGGAGGGPYGETELAALQGGSGGGAGACDAGEAAAAGGGGGALQLASAVSVTISASGAVDAGGGGGAGGLYRGTSHLGAGGGGGSGGSILIEAPDIAISGMITAAGGGGGSGAYQRRAGRPGEDGFLALAGAQGGASSSGNTGGDGSTPDDGSGEAAPDVEYSGGHYSLESGGGGGGAGRIRINFFFELAMAPGLAHPGMDTGLFSTGEIGLE